MSTEDDVFKALSDPSRRYLLDLLYEKDGRTLGDLESKLAMSRFGVMKHLKLLEQANLVITRRQGREKHHYLNPVPIQEIYNRWIDKFRAQHTSALVEMKMNLEEQACRKSRKRA